MNTEDKTSDFDSKIDYASPIIFFFLIFLLIGLKEEIFSNFFCEDKSIELWCGLNLTIIWVSWFISSFFYLLFAVIDIYITKKLIKIKIIIFLIYFVIYLFALKEIFKF